MTRKALEDAEESNLALLPEERDLSIETSTRKSRNRSSGIWRHVTSTRVLLTLLFLSFVLNVIAIWKLRSSHSVGNTDQCKELAAEGVSRSPLGRDPTYMTIDHGADDLWNQYLGIHLGVFEADEDTHSVAEYSM
jgi:hypothetical protein